MTLVVVPDDAFGNEFVATRGFGGPGISKIGAGIQAGRLAYRLSKSAYQRYFRYATRTRSRQAGTGSGAGIGIGAGLVAICQTSPVATSYQIRQARNYLEQSKRKRIKCYVHKPRTRRQFSR